LHNDAQELNNVRDERAPEIAEFIEIHAAPFFAATTERVPSLWKTSQPYSMRDGRNLYFEIPGENKINRHKRG